MSTADKLLRLLSALFIASAIAGSLFHDMKMHREVEAIKAGWQMTQNDHADEEEEVNRLQALAAERLAVMYARQEAIAALEERLAGCEP